VDQCPTNNAGRGSMPTSMRGDAEVGSGARASMSTKKHGGEESAGQDMRKRTRLCEFVAGSAGEERGACSNAESTTQQPRDRSGTVIKKGEKHKSLNVENAVGGNCDVAAGLRVVFQCSSHFWECNVRAGGEGGRDGGLFAIGLLQQPAGL